MFCPKCGELGFVSPSQNLTCTNNKCGYSGSAQNIAFIDNREIDLSQITTRSKIEGSTRGHREFGDSMSPIWDEPSCRLESTQSRECPECSSQNLRIISSEEECRDCGSHVP